MNSKRDILERLCDLLWFASIIPTILFLEIGMVFALKEPPSYQLLMSGLLCIPVVIMARNYGVTHLHFKEHEEALDNSCILEGMTDLENEITKLALEIENSESWERQEARAKTKKWLNAEWKNLEKSEKELAHEKFSYLTPKE